MKYVELDAVLAVATDWCPDDDGSVAKTGDIREMLDELESIPTADVRPVVHSKWIPFPNNGVWDFKCDICHRIIPFGQTPDTIKYCPNCGADMREVT